MPFLSSSELKCQVNSLMVKVKTFELTRKNICLQICIFAYIHIRTEVYMQVKEKEKNTTRTF